jgi:hypothetical protein
MKTYRIIIFPVVLYGREKLSLILREEPILRVFENRVLREICEPKMGEVRAEWRRLRKEKLYDLYSVPTITRVIKSTGMSLAGQVACMGDRRGAYRVSAGET